MNTMIIRPFISATRALQSLAFVLALTLAGTAYAKQAYNVELILFKYSRDEYFNNENWPDEWPIPDTAEAVDLDHVDADYRDTIRTLTNSGHTLGAIADSLEKSSRYELLAYRAWRQPGLDKDNAVDILIRTGDKYEKQSRTVPAPDDESMPQKGTLFLRPGDITRPGDGMPVAEGVSPARSDEADQPLTEHYRRISRNSEVDPADAVYELEGTVKIVLSRFLHVYTDLLLMQPVRLEPIERQPAGEADPADSTAPRLASMKPEAVQRYKIIPVEDDESFTTLQGIHIQQHRRMRSGELHHLDHPLLGAIVKVTPAKK